MKIPTRGQIERNAEESAKEMQRSNGLPKNIAQLVCQVEIATALRYIEHITGEIPKYAICDGCNVRDGHEHRCHGNNIVINGDFTDKKCECNWESCKHQQQ